MIRDHINDFRNEETLNEIMRYKELLENIRDTGEQLRQLWNDEAGSEIYRRVMNLADEMNENCERLKRWIGSGLL